MYGTKWSPKLPQWLMHGIPLRPVVLPVWGLCCPLRSLSASSRLRLSTERSDWLRERWRPLPKGGVRQGRGGGGGSGVRNQSSFINRSYLGHNRDVIGHPEQHQPNLGLLSCCWCWCAANVWNFYLIRSAAVWKCDRKCNIITKWNANTCPVWACCRTKCVLCNNKLQLGKWFLLKSLTCWFPVSLYPFVNVIDIWCMVLKTVDHIMAIFHRSKSPFQHALLKSKDWLIDDTQMDEQKKVQSNKLKKWL